MHLTLLYSTAQKTFRNAGSFRRVHQLSTVFSDDNDNYDNDTITMTLMTMTMITMTLIVMTTTNMTMTHSC